MISAFIKSMRGSDPQAAVYYLARMLEAGEDARFIARRMIIFASEDVGMADPQALLVAVAAAQAARARRPARGAAQPQPGRHPPGHRAEEQPVRRWRSGTPAPTCRTVPSARCRRTCATRTTRAPNHSATGSATTTLMTIREGWIDQQYLPDEQQRQAVLRTE